MTKRPMYDPESKHSGSQAAKPDSETRKRMRKQSRDKNKRVARLAARRRKTTKSRKARRQSN